ncbi:calcium-binding protein [Tabrizicola oligotrophica]|uniref:Calcium-binding protein n=1 Tax=Tabrizicola oligotrophica TaxID=2710650 RepID=A0A6M0QUK4_9RHOB|nr:calcium-binding protein [Tabrizicola oligotrophica]NEY90681.1 calcium-binding protein [Tabrizicola oligotrophica]
MPVSPFSDVTSLSQLPPGIDPRCLVNIDRLDASDPEASPAEESSGIHIGGGIILTAAHVFYELDSTVGGGVRPDSRFDLTFGSGLPSIADVTMSIATNDPAQRLVEGRDRFQSFSAPVIGADIAMIDLAPGGPIDAGDAGYLNSVQATPMVLFANLDDADGTDITLLGYPAASRDGATLCRADGEITGNGDVDIIGSGETLVFYSAALSLEGGFSGGPVFASLAFEGGSGTYLLGLASASFGPEDGLIAPMSVIYAALGASLASFHSADAFARNVLVSDRSASGTVQGQFFHEDFYGGAFADTILAAGGDDAVRGGQGRDQIFGGLGSDTIFGGAGGDRISDGAGVDILFADGGDDVIFASGAGSANTYRGGAGSDTLSYRGITGGLTLDLAAGTVTGPQARHDVVRGIEHAEGGQGSDAITGDDLANVLDGRQGNDTLFGGLGADSFAFSTSLDAATNVDRLGDFQHLSDRILLVAPAFSVLGAAVQATDLHLGTAAAEANDRLIYDRATGRLFFDADGAGALDQVLFARLVAGTALSAADFLMG